MEIEYDYLSFQISKMTLVSLVVSQCNVENARLHNLTCLDLVLLVLGSNDTLVLHTLNGNIMKVLPTFCMGVISVPTCSNSSESLNILLVSARVEDKPIAKCLE